MLATVEVSEKLPAGFARNYDADPKQPLCESRLRKGGLQTLLAEKANTVWRQ